MDATWSEEQTLLRESAEKLLSAEYDWTQRRASLDAGGCDEAVWRRFAGMGWLALPIAEAHGGLGGGFADLGLLLRAFGAALVVEPVVPTVVLGAGAIALAGTEAQRATLLPRVADGTLRLALAHAETLSDPDPARLATVARQRNGSWQVSGRKVVVMGASAADTLIVSARAEPDNAPSLFLVPRLAPGVSLDDYPLIDGTRTADIALDGAVVGADARLSSAADIAGLLTTLLDHAVVATACEAVGAMDALLAATTEYVKTRVQFGQPIGRFQVVQHRLADMAVAREEAAAIALAACLLVEREPARAAASAKIKLARAARMVAEQAVQLHGAMGVTEELTVGAWLKRILVFELAYGDADHHRARLAALARAPGMIARGLLG